VIENSKFLLLYTHNPLFLPFYYKIIFIQFKKKKHKKKSFKKALYF
jgi:CRISPR/Cas system CSM-associated protein Csm4 (group 5 of RAMP superfamily)